MLLIPSPRCVLLTYLVCAFAQTTSAAYVQFQDCHGSKDATTPRLNIEALRASLDISAPKLELNLTGSYLDDKTCDVVSPDHALAKATVSSLGGSTSYSTTTETICHQYSSPNHNRALIHHQLAYDIAWPAFLDTLEISLDLVDNASVPIACVTAHITPALSSTASRIAVYVPISSFLLILILAIWHEITPLPSEAYQQGPLMFSPSPTHLTLVSQILSYIQFIFFSASLALFYPGFLRAVASNSSWSTLMIPHGPILSSTPYYGIKDGIYEVNGTFGGTTGLELMTQVLGAPVTIHTWANIISLSLILLVGMVLLFQVSHRLPFTQTWISVNSARFRGTTDSGVRGTTWTVLRVFLSYFLTPITAWTTYQLTGATFFPIYHTVLTAFVIALLVAAFWWSVTQSSPRNMGYLILDSSKRLQTPGNMSKSEDRHAMATFALMFVRGAAIGGLQVAGLVQLLILLACEIVQLLIMGFTWKCFPLFRLAGVLTTAKLAILGISIGFLPNITGHKTNIVLGLVVLGIHGIVLLGCFILPGLVRVGMMMTHTFYLTWPRNRNLEEIEDHRLRSIHPRDSQTQVARPVSVGTFDTPRCPSSLLMSPMSTAPLRDNPREDTVSLATARGHRLSLSSSSSEGSNGLTRMSKELVEASDFDEDDIEELGSPSNVHEARLGRRFSKASVFNYSRPVNPGPESP